VHAMKAYEGVRVQFHTFLTLGLNGGEWLVSCPGFFTPGQTAVPNTHWTGEWAGPELD